MSFLINLFVIQPSRDLSTHRQATAKYEDLCM